MRILALVTDAYGGRGGIAQANRDLFAALAAEHEIVILPRNGNGETPANVKQLQPIGPRFLYSVRALIEAWRGGFDVVFCGHLFMAPLAVFVAVLAHVPYWLHLYGIEAWKQPRFPLRWAAERACLATAISRYTRRQFLSWARTVPERVKILPVTFDPRFSPGPRSVEILRKYGLEGKQVLLTVARLSAVERYKGHDKVIMALPRILKTHPSAAYLVAGEGNDRARLEAAARKAGVEDYVVFAGAVPDGEMVNLYRSANVFVMPSAGEGFGIAFLEAAACGLPVIGGRFDGSWDALREGRLGSAIDPDDQDTLVAAIDKTLNHPDVSAEEVELFSNARQRAHLTGLVEALHA